MLRFDVDIFFCCYCSTACDILRNLLLIGSASLSYYGGSPVGRGLPNLLMLEGFDECQVPEDFLPWLPDTDPIIASALILPDKLFCSGTWGPLGSGIILSRSNGSLIRASASDFRLKKS